MHYWLGRMPWAFGWLLAVATAFGAPPSVDQIRAWLRQLESHDLAVCAEASRNLSDAGDTAVDALLCTVGKADAEAAWRATGVLEQIALQGNDSTLRRVTAGFKELADRGRPGLDGIIGQLQTRQARLQREQAVAKIRSLGGRFDGDEKAAAPLASRSGSTAPSSQSAVEPPPEIPAGQPVSAVELSTLTGIGLIGDPYVSPEFVVGVESKEPEVVLTIDEHWRGGDAGLASLLDLGNVIKLRFRRAPLTDAALEQVAAIAQLQSVEFEDCQFTAAAVKRLQERQPRTQILVHGT
jgi:hypothetical protein